MGRARHCSAEERRLVRQLRNEGKTYASIANLIGRSQNFVTNALKPEKIPLKRGQRKKTSTATDERIKLLVKRDPFMSSRRVASEIGNVVSSRTVRRRLQAAGLHGRMACKVPLLRTVNIKKRQNFALAHKDWCGEEGSKKWRNVLWSDETKINLFGNDCQRNVRRPKGKRFHIRFTKKTVKHGGGNIMVWGCFSWQGVGPIHLIDGIMDRHVYKNILQTVMLPYADDNMPLLWKFQQDNDPKHSSKTVKEWFQQNNVDVMEWPSQSPDLNPIENLWAILKKEISKHVVTNKQQLWEIVQRTWYSIPVETCRRLISSMPSRVGKVLQNKGGYTGY